MISSELRTMDSYDLNRVQVSLRDRLVFLMRGGMVKRFHNAATLQENTVAQHSWGVALFSYLLSDGKPSANLLLAALAHDMAEQIIGDIPAPAKRLLGIRPLLHSKEAEVMEDFGFDFESELTMREQKIIALADCMDGMLYAIRERMLGNRFMEFTFQKFQSYIVHELETEMDHAVFQTLIQLFEDANGGSIVEGQ